MNKKIKIFPVFLILLGIIFLLDTINIYNGAFTKLWPLLLIVVGTLKIINNLLENKNKKQDKIKEKHKEKTLEY